MTATENTPSSLRPAGVVALRRTPSPISALALGVAIGILQMAGAQAAVITQTQTDAINTNSLIAGVNFPGGAPVAGNDYVTDSDRAIRSPTTGNSTFLGNSLTVTGGARLYLAGSTTPTTTTTIGNLIVDNGRVWNVNGTTNTRILAGGLTVGAGGVVFDPRSTGRLLNIASTINGSGAIRVLSGLGGGVVSFSNAANAYTGNVTVESTGVLRQTVAGALSSAGAGLLTVDGVLQLNTGGAATASTSAAVNALAGTGTVTNGNTASTLTLDGTSGSNTFSGAITGGGLSLVKAGTNVQTLTGANTYAGGTTISGGELRVSGAGTLGSGGVSVDGGTLGLAGGATVGNTVTVEGRGDDAQAQIASGAGDNTLNGPLVLKEATADNPARFNLAANGGAGDTFTVAATVTDNSVGNDRLDLGGAGTGEVTSALTMVGAGTDTLAKSGDGKWTLSGGATADEVAVDDGTLSLNSALATTGNVTIASGAALNQQGSQRIVAANQAGGYVVNGTLDMGGLAASVNWLNGAGTVTSNSTVDPLLTLGNNSTDGSFSGVIQDGTGDPVSIEKVGTNTQSLSGNNTYTGTTTVSDGALRVQSNNALGATDVGTTVTGTGRVELFDSAGALTLGEAFTLIGRTDDTVHLSNVAGANTITAAVTLADNASIGSDNEAYSLTSDSGTLTLAVGVTSALTTGTRTLNLGGAANGVINGLVTANTPTRVEKTDSGTWTITDANMANADEIVTQSGTLVLSGSTAIAGVDTLYQVASGATLDVSGVTGGFNLTPNQIMQGEGTIVGPVTTQNGSAVNPDGDGVDVTGTLAVTGALTLGGTLNIDIFGAASDLLNVSSALDITNGNLALNLGALAANTHYVFAKYGSLVPDGEFATVTGLIGEYEIVYNYNDGNSSNNIALYTKQTPIPAPLVLIGLGLFGIGAMRRRFAR